MISERIYRKDAKGGLRFWQYEVERAAWRTIIGMIGGIETTSGWTVCIGKNIGRSNETTPEQQAAFEAEAELRKKLDREYRRAVEELDSVPISPMLAQDFKKQKAITYPVYSQRKLDGIRMLASRHGAFSREYQPHFNVEHIMEALAPLFAALPGAIFDGELYNHSLRDNFNRISSVVRRQTVTDEDRIEARAVVQFHVYDMVVTTSFGHRSETLADLLRDMPRCIQVVPTDYAPDKESIDKLYAEYLEQGYEGQMVRLDGPYEADKRSKLLLKRKEFLTDEFRLLRVEEGNGNWAGYAKRAVFALPDGREVGAGIRGDQAFTKQLLAAAPTWGDGRQVTVRYFTPTPDGIPRFPVAVDWHPNGRAD